MRQIIKGKVYDTDKATLIYNYEDDYISTLLYQKKNGEYFIYQFGDSLFSFIHPITFEEAENWCKRHNIDFQNLYRHEEDEGKVRISLYVEKNWWNNIKKMASIECVSASEYVEGSCK